MRKHTIFAVVGAIGASLALLAAPAPALGNDRAELSPNTFTEKLCTTWGELARQVMGLRQAGADAPTIMSIYYRDDVFADLRHHVVEAAFDHPQLSDQASRDKLVTTFASDQYFQCVNAFKRQRKSGIR